MTAESTPEFVQREQSPTVTHINVLQELQKNICPLRFVLHHTKTVVELSMDVRKRVIKYLHVYVNVD